MLWSLGEACTKAQLWLLIHWPLMTLNPELVIVTCQWLTLPCG